MYISSLRIILDESVSCDHEIWERSADVIQTVISCNHYEKKGKRKVQGVPQSQIAALPRHQEEAEIDKSKQAQIEQTYKKH